MLVSNNNLLNILLPNDNKVLKDVLKEADVKTLNSLKSGNTSVNDILRNLFTDLKSGQKNMSTIENILKNSNIFKDLGSFSKSVTTLLNQIDADSNLSKYKPLLQSFLKDISTLDDKSLKDLINKSGVFLESKILQQSKEGTVLPRNLENILNQIKTILKDIPGFEAKKIGSLIDKILLNNQKNISQNAQNQSNLSQNNTQNSTQKMPNEKVMQQNSSDLKALVSQLQNLAKNVGDKQLANLTLLTNSLKNISNEAQLIESKLSNNTNSQAQVKNAQSTTNTQVQNQATNAQNVNTQVQAKNTPIQTIIPNTSSESKVPNSQVQNQANQQNPSNINASSASQTVNQTKNTIISKVLQILMQVKAEVQTNASTLPNAQNITKQVDSLLQNSNLFSGTNNLAQVKTTLENFSNLNDIKTASNQNNTIASLINSLKTQISGIEKLLTQVSPQVQANQGSQTGQTIQSTQTQGNVQQAQNQTQGNINTQKADVQNLPQMKESVITKVLETLVQLKNELATNTSLTNSQNIVKQLDSLLQNNDLFSKNSNLVEPKNLLNQLTNLNDIKTAANQNPNISNIVNSLKNQVETINNLETKVLQNQNVQTEKLQITTEIKQNLTALKTELITVKGIDTNLINQIIDKLTNMQNIFSKLEIPLDLKNFSQNLLNQTLNLSNFQSNFSSNLNSLILTLKESITSQANNTVNNNLQQTIIKTIDKLEGMVNNFIQNPSLLADKNSPNPLQNDMKTVLLQMQSELVSKTDVSSQETLKNVEKMLMQIDYHQLLSLASNSNSVYIPFIWDMLDEGSISMKKLDEEKFYCEINLSLKEFGQTQLLLALYDKNKLDLTIYASKDSFKEALKENAPKLRQGLNSVDLIPVSIKIIDFKKEQESSKEVKESNIYSHQSQDLGFGVDIKV